MPKWKGNPFPIAPGLRAALAPFFMGVSNVAGGLVLPKFHRSAQKHRRPQCRPFFTSKFFQNILGLSVRSSTEIEAPGRAPAAFDNPPKPILRFLPQIGEWMFMALVAVKLEKAEIWHG